ncbi:TRAP transporter substrate-binding protein [Azohydromonas caseinilytica]|uniref:TRAP transporter substrate-binding protein n=1 Tax=Azohydromonas caseinilytica TaxID=2728836 RepID=A0A848FJ36_9BURK|nr:TRAP transporter substrate-binding protein [Azohydromonas caseinilytica]NML18220.1 TRAP transporter substrate-binding protein [Azohydromonas caseinilytica]
MKTFSGMRRAMVAAAALLLAASAGHAADIKERTLRFAFQSAKDHPIGVGAQKFADLVSQKSGGKISVKLFPNGTLGGDLQVVSALQGGVVDLTALSSGLLSGQVKEFVLFDLPFQFNNGREADAVVDGPIGRKLGEKLVDKGLVPLGYWELGFRNLTNSRHPVAKADDFKGLKIRVVQSPIYIDLFNILGANAVPMPFPEVYSALETKAVDGQENPLKSIELSKFYEVQPYLSLTRHIYSPLSILIGRKAWDKLSPDEQQIIRQAAAESQAYQRQFARAEDAKSLDVLKKSMKVAELPPAEVAKVRERIKPVVEKYAKDVGEPLMSELNAELAKVRGSGK